MSDPLNPIKEMFTAIYEASAADATLSGLLTGGLHKGKAPSGTAVPYAVFGLDDEGDEDSFDTRVPVFVVSFTIYGSTDTPDQVLDIYAALDAVYRDQTFELDNYHHHETTFESAGPLLVDPEDGFYQYSADYVFSLEAK